MGQHVNKNTAFKQWLPTIGIFLFIGAMIFIPWEGSNWNIKWYQPIIYVGIWLIMIWYARVLRPKLEKR